MDDPHLPIVYELTMGRILRIHHRLIFSSGAVMALGIWLVFTGINGDNAALYLLGSTMGILALVVFVYVLTIPRSVSILHESHFEVKKGKSAYIVPYLDIADIEIAYTKGVYQCFEVVGHNGEKRRISAPKAFVAMLLVVFSKEAQLRELFDNEMRDFDET